LLSRLRSRLIWREVAEVASPSEKAGSDSERSLRSERPEFLGPVTPREYAIGLLHIGAEVEHALMVQYLYAAYSLDENQNDDGRRSLVKKWKSTILEIAREEMGHLVTVQNLLSLIGGPISFEREDYPIQDPELLPFPFQLEPLTKISLGRYILAEMPSEEVLKAHGRVAEINQIRANVQATSNLKVHRVGLIYDQITTLFTSGPVVQGPLPNGEVNPHPFIATVDIQSDSLSFQASPSAWGLGYQDLLIEIAEDRQSALAAIKLITEQGEGIYLPKELDKSHFGKFLEIYRSFPDEGSWRPSRNVANNPTTNPSVDDPARRMAGQALPWATLCNLRYHMLLLYLKHSFSIESHSASALKSARGTLISWAFGEMYNIRSISERLMCMPLGHGNQLAGPPFDMPYSLALPSRSADCWRGHRDLLMACAKLSASMLQTRNEAFLRALQTSDQTRLQQVNAIIGV
jgi:hypothetical protein